MREPRKVAASGFVPAASIRIGWYDWQRSVREHLLVELCDESLVVAIVELALVSGIVPDRPDGFQIHETDPLITRDRMARAELYMKVACLPRPCRNEIEELRALSAVRYTAGHHVPATDATMKNESVESRCGSIVIEAGLYGTQDAVPADIRRIPDFEVPAVRIPVASCTQHPSRMVPASNPANSHVHGDQISQRNIGQLNRSMIHIVCVSSRSRTAPYARNVRVLYRRRVAKCSFVLLS